jgi:hypothetical protein
MTNNEKYFAIHKRNKTRLYKIYHNKADRNRLQITRREGRGLLKATTYREKFMNRAKCE